MSTADAQFKAARRADKARARFFAPIGGIKRRNARFADDLTMPLFPLVLILDADGTLAAGARHLVEGH